MSEKLSSSKIDKIKSRLHPMFLAEERAKELLPLVPNSSLFVAICGIELGINSFEIVDNYANIRKVTNPPGVIHVTRAADYNHVDYLGVSRHSSNIHAELAIGERSLTSRKIDAEPDLNISWHLMALIKLVGHTSLYCPVAASRSWDVISAFSDNSVIFYFLDDIPHQISFPHSPTSVSIEEMNWVRQYWETALTLRDFDKSRRFGLAFNIMYTWNHTSDLRIALVNLWTGLEALFGKRSDRRVSEALAARISNWVSFLSEKAVRDLYTQRCNAVHGRWLEDQEVIGAIIESEKLLRISLRQCIETNTTTLPDWS